jgi:DNA adenine methylase
MEEEVGDLKPAFCRQGNKYPLRGKIIPLIPPHETYVELFAGSGAIFFNKPKAKTNVLNDLDKATMKRFALLKKAPLDPDTYRQDLNTLKRIKEFYNHHGNSVQDQILLEKIISCDGFSGKPVTSEKGIYKDYNPASVVKLMKDYHAKLQGVTLTTKDYEAIVKKYDSPTTFFFIDPPYENTSKTFGYAEDQEFDFQRLAETLSKIKGRFLMTINDSKNIRNIFKQFNQKPVDVYTAWGHTSKDKSKRTRKELFITNYQMAKHQISA